MVSPPQRADVTTVTVPLYERSYKIQIADRLSAAIESTAPAIMDDLSHALVITDEGARVFKDAVALAFVSDCLPLDDVDFHPLLDRPLREVREAVGLEVDLLKAYYRIEANRYPHCAASQRLLT